MDRLRLPLFIAAAIVILLAVIVEGSGSLPTFAKGFKPSDQHKLPSISLNNNPFSSSDPNDEEANRKQADFLQQFDQPTPPGLGIASLALLDGLIVFTVILLGAGIVLPGAIH